MTGIKKTIARRILSGAGGGLAATGVMTGVFAALEAAGWLGQLPPRQIIDRVLSRSGEERAQVITMVAHFGYGAFLGSMYSALSPSPSTVRGTAYGVSVCLASYEGMMPLLRIRQPLHRDSRREIAALVIAHIAYGSSLGWAVKHWR